MRELVYISYSHEDKKWRERVRAELDKIPELIVWDDTDIPAGSDWKAEVDDHVGARHSHAEHRHQALSAGEYARLDAVVLVLREACDRLVHAVRRDVVERCGLHALSRLARLFGL